MFKRLEKVDMVELIKEFAAADKRASENRETTLFHVSCKNCIISIFVYKKLTAENKEEVVTEVGLRELDDSDFYNLYNEEFPWAEVIINEISLPSVFALIAQFRNLEKENFAEVWEAWNIIARHS